MRVDDLTVEVRDRTLKRVGQVTPAYLDLKARTKWCGVGEWTVTLPGDHPMVSYLSEPGSGLLVTGPDGVVVHPPTYSDWREERRNLFPNPEVLSLSGFTEASSQNTLTYENGAAHYTLAGTMAVGIGVTGFSATPGTSYRLLMRARSNRDLTARARIRTNSGAYLTITPEWQWFEVTTESGAGTDTQTGFLLDSGAGHIAGDWIEIDRVLIALGGDAGNWFGGGDPGDLQRTRWIGTENGSESVYETRQMTRGSWRETTYGTLWSGPTRTPTRVRNQQNPDGTFTFSGVTDEVLLQGARAFPNPNIGDPQASSQSRTNDTRTGTTESLLRAYVAWNISGRGGSQGPAERIRGLRKYLGLVGSNQNRGLTQQKSPRFQNLLELLQEIVAYDPSLGFRIVQVGSTLEFQVLDARDRRAFVRFDVENGTIVSEEVQTGGPIVTDAIVAGQGEGKDRTIVRRQTPEAIAAESEWGVVFEEFIDQRDTDDLGELQQSGDERLQEGQGGTAVKMVPSDDTTMQVNVDWRQGDVVTTVVSGQETVARVTEVAYSVTASGVMAGAALGDVSGFTQKDAESSKVQSIDSRVSNLERASAGPVDWARIINEPTTFPPAAHTHPWSEVTGRPSTFPPSSHTHPWSQITDPLVNTGGDVDASAVPSSFPLGISIRTAGAGFPASIGTVVTERHSGYRQVQWFYDRSAVARAWFRTANGDAAWQDWREVITDATPGVPFATAAGVVAPAASGYTTVTFPTGRFSVPPIVRASGGDQSSVGVPRIVSVTATSFQIGIWTLGGAQVAGSGVAWEATQMTAGSASG